jgi:hypothetical protein
MRNYFLRFITIILINSCSVSSCIAQYTTSVGLRAGKFASGADVKHFLDKSGNTGFEIFAGYTDEAFGGYLGRMFFLKQLSLSKAKYCLRIPIKTIFGVGGHVGYFKDRYYSIQDGQSIPYGDNIFACGIDAVFGLEYNSRKIPFTVGIDAIPYYSLLNPGPEWLDLGVTLRYIIK